MLETARWPLRCDRLLGMEGDTYPDFTQNGPFTMPLEERRRWTENKMINREREMSGGLPDSPTDMPPQHQPGGGKPYR